LVVLCNVRVTQDNVKIKINNKKIKKPLSLEICSDPRNSDTDFGGFTMSKLSKQDKIHIFKEWTLEEKRGTYLGKNME
jgi:hypothetical protein